jgi:hypothetical protein
MHQRSNVEDQIDISFNMFCQMLLHIASSLNAHGGVQRRGSEYAAVPITIMSVTMQDVKKMGFQDSYRVGLSLRLLLTVMDRSMGRQKMEGERSSTAVGSLLGVVGSSDSVTLPASTKHKASPRSATPIKQRREIISKPMDAQILAVVKTNRPQLLLLALHYSHFNPSAVLSEKEKIACVYLSKDDVWNLAVDFGIGPVHCRCASVSQSVSM